MDLPIHTLTFKSAREDLVFIKSILEGYDNLAIMTTLDPTEGLFEVRVPHQAVLTITTVLTELLENNQLSFLEMK